MRCNTVYFGSNVAYFQKNFLQQL